MKLIRVIITATIVFISSLVYGQAGLYMYINTVGYPSEFTSGTHNHESKIDAISEGESLPISPTGVGKPSVSDVNISMPYGAPSLAIGKALFNGTNIPAVEFRFYNTTDVLVYSIKIENVQISSLQSSGTGAGCSSGCPGLVQSASFYYGKITWSDFVRNFTLTYNRQTNLVTSTGF